MARLIRTIEGEILPRLVVSRRAQESAALDVVDVAELVRLLLAHNVGVSSAYIEALRRRGATLEMICLGLLAPAARQLGTMWEEDDVDFMQVTVGLCRLHQLLRELSGDYPSEDNYGKSGRRILLATCPGEQHTFGIAVVAQFLRRAGWDVWPEFPATAAQIVTVIGQHSFSAVGFSVATDARLDELSETIRAIRKVSQQRTIGILAGGPILAERPQLAAAVGADATAADGFQAVLRAEDVCSMLAAAH
jgi:methanogenic corrinoid protein MtbC1